MIPNIDKLIFSVNSFVTTLINRPETYISIVCFSKNMKYICKGLEIGQVGILNKSHFTGFSSTALYDSVCTILTEWQNSPGKHKLFIITDGDDNDSRIYTKEQTDVLCKSAISSGNWDIVHCHTEISELSVSKSVVYEVEDISNIMNNLVI